MFGYPVLRSKPQRWIPKIAVWVPAAEKCFKIVLGETRNLSRKFRGDSSERGCRASRDRAGLWGSPGNFQRSPGNFRESPGNFRGSPGNFRGTWIAVKFHSERTSGEVAEKLLGKFGELPGESGDFQKLGVARLPLSDSAPALYKAWPLFSEVLRSHQGLSVARTMYVGKHESSMFCVCRGYAHLLFAHPFFLFCPVHPTLPQPIFLIPSFWDL